MYVLWPEQQMLNRKSFIHNFELFLILTDLPLIDKGQHGGSKGLFYKHGLTLIPAWISNYSHQRVWDEITYPFLNFNSATVDV